MANKYFYLYLTLAIAGLCIVIYEIVTQYPYVDYESVSGEALPGILMAYLAYKSYHEKKDGELM